MGERSSGGFQFWVQEAEWGEKDWHFNVWKFHTEHEMS